MLLMAAVGPALHAADFSLTIIHTNDVHSHVEPTAIRGKDYGGYARVATLVKDYRKADPDAILLSAGDVFQGSLYFNVYEGLADLAAMNAMRYDAMALGNHEFDKGTQVLGTFCKGADFPILSANLDVSADVHLKDYVKPSIVLTIKGEKIGIVGAVTPDLPFISSPGPDVKMKNLIASLTDEVAKLNQQGVSKIIVLSHCGMDVEKDEIAAKVPGVDVVVGGHSHTLLGKSTAPGFPQSRGAYPTVVTGTQGNKVLIVQAWEWSKVLGKINITFDEKGTVKSWSDDQPRVVDDSIVPDLTVASMISAFQKPIAQLQSKVVGETKTGLPRSVSGKRFLNPIAFVIADAQLDAVKSQGAVAAFINAGGVRSAIEAGPITYGEAIAVQPFSNTIVVMELTGSELKDALEWGVRELPDGSGGMLYPSAGTSYTVDAGKKAGERVVDVIIGGEKLDPNKTYVIAINNFVAGGGDAHAVIKNAKGKRTDTGLLDIDAMIDYFGKHNPVADAFEPRILLR